MRWWIGACLFATTAAAAAVAAPAAFTLLEGQEVARSLPLRDLPWHALGYTPDGGRLLAVDADGAALLDDRGQPRARPTCPQSDGAAAVDVSAARDGSGIAVRFANGRVCTWDASGLTQLGAAGPDTTAAAIASEKVLVLGFADGRLEGRSPRTGARRWMRNPELGPVVHLRMEAAGPRIAASTGTMGVSVVDTRNGRLVRGLRGPPAFAAAFDPTGSTLAVGRANGRVEIWDTKHWVARQTVRFAQGTVVDVDFSPDGTQVAAATERGAGAERVVTLEVYDLSLAELVLRETAPAGPGPTRLRYDRSGDRLVVGNGPAASRMWSRPGARQIPRPPPNDEPPHQRPFVDPPVLPPLPVAAPERIAPGAVAVSDDGGRVLVWTDPAVAQVAPDAPVVAPSAAPSARKAPVPPSPDAAAPDAAAPDAAAPDAPAPPSAASSAAPAAPSAAPAAPVASSGTTTPAPASAAQTAPLPVLPPGLAVIDAATGAMVPLAGSTTAARPYTLSAEGARVAARVGDRLHVWDTTSGALTGRIAVAEPRAVALLGARIAIATVDGKVYAGTTERLRVVPDTTGVTAVALDPFHADRVAVGNADGAVRIVEIRTGAALGAWGVHAGALSALAFSDDGRLLATAGPLPGADGGQVIVLGTDREADEEPWSAVLDAIPTRLAFASGGATPRVLAVSPRAVTLLERAGAVLDLSDTVVDACLARTGVRWVDTTGAVRTVSPSTVLAPVPRGRLFARSDDGRFSVTVDGDRVSVWDDRAGLLLRAVPATGQAVRGAVFDDTGDRVAVLYADAAIEIYEVATGEALRNLPGPPAGAPAWLRFSDDGTRLWTLAGPRVVTAYAIDTGEARERVELPGMGPVSVDPATTRGRFVRFRDAVPASLPTGPPADAWLDTSTTSPRRLTLPADGFRPLAVDPRGKWLVAVQEGAVVRLDVDSLRRVGPPMTVTGAADPPGAVAALSADGKWLATAHQSGLVRVWDVERGLMATSLGADARLVNRGPAQPVASLAFDAAAEVVTARDATGFPRLWEWRLSIEAPAVGLGAGPVLPSTDIRALAVSPDGKALYSAHGDGNARAWDLATGAQTNFFWGHAGAVTTLAVGGGGARLVTGSEDGTVRAWEASTGIEKMALNAFGDAVRILAASADGWHLAAVGDGAVLRTWDAGKGKATRRWAVSGGRPTSLFFGPGGGSLAVTLPDGTAWTLDPTTGAVAPSAGTGPLPGREPPVPDPDVAAVRARATALAPISAEVRTPDRRTLVTAGTDGRIRLWDLDTNTLRATLRAMSDGSWIVDRADGTRHASESLRDGTSPRLYRPPPR